MEFSDLLTKMTQAICQERPIDVAACFCEDGEYHDVFYGQFVGRKSIINLIENYFYRDAREFRWDLHDPVSTGSIGYCRYIFSFESKLEAAAGRRVAFEGIANVKIKNGLIYQYSEVADTFPALQRLGFTSDRIGKMASKAASRLESRHELSGHL